MGFQNAKIIQNLHRSHFRTKSTRRGCLLRADIFDGSKPALSIRSYRALRIRSSPSATPGAGSKDKPWIIPGPFTASLPFFCSHRTQLLSLVYSPAGLNASAPSPLRGFGCSAVALLQRRLRLVASDVAYAPSSNFISLALCPQVQLTGRDQDPDQKLDHLRRLTLKNTAYALIARSLTLALK